MTTEVVSTFIWDEVDKFKNEAVKYSYEYLNLVTPGNSDLPGDFMLGQNKYDFRQRTFPEDLGSSGSYNGHYMVININVNDKSRMASTSRGSSGGNKKWFTKMDNELSTVDTLRANLDKTWKNQDGDALNNPVFVSRQTRRIKESIALYMPNTVVFSGRNDYSEVSLTDMVGQTIQSVAGGVFGSTGRDAVSLGRGLLEKTQQVKQQPINPRVEVLFSNTALRQFQFDFLFAPSSPSESESLNKIIQTLRFHAAPEYNSFSSITDWDALLWLPPSDFDITFFNRGKENRSIPKINTCVMTGIDVDYAPSGVYSTFSNGMPVQVRMQLSLTEVEVAHRLRVAQGF